MVKNRWVRIALTLLVVVGIFMATGLRVAHPKLGLESALGAAKTSVVIYKKNKDVTDGAKVVVKLNEGWMGLAIVSEVNEDSVDVNLETKFERIPTDDIGGNLLAVLPFIGVLFGVIGLYGQMSTAAEQFYSVSSWKRPYQISYY